MDICHKSWSFTKTAGLRLVMKQRDGAWKSVGTLFVRCKPGDLSEPRMEGECRPVCSFANWNSKICCTLYCRALHRYPKVTISTWRWPCRGRTWIVLMARSHLTVIQAQARASLRVPWWSHSGCTVIDLPGLDKEQLDFWGFFWCFWGLQC